MPRSRSTVVYSRFWESSFELRMVKGGFYMSFLEGKVVRTLTGSLFECWPADEPVNAILMKAMILV